MPKTAATALLVGLGVLVPYLVPGWQRFRLVSGADVARFEGSFRGSPRAPLVKWNEAPAAAPKPVRVSRLPAEASAARPVRRQRLPPFPEVPIEDPSGDLGRFFGRLGPVAAGVPGALVRITHLGDSPLTGDLISGAAREALQAELGDGGPGFVLAGRPWAWYGHEGVRIEAHGWTARSPLLETGDGGRHGLGLVSFTSGSTSARSEIRCERGSFTRAEVTFTGIPGGGTLLVSVDGGVEREVPTSAASPRTGKFDVAAPGGASRIDLRPKGDGEVTVYGIVLETGGPGLVYDAVGANGASVFTLDRLDGKDWEEALALRGSDLVVLNYGTNESLIEGIGGRRYEKEYGEAIDRVRRALPAASILVMAPMDRGERLSDGTVGTLPSIRRLVAVQRRVAREKGCAFFDTFAAMGGEGTMGRWYENEPRLVSGDFTHPTRAGSGRIARLFVGALRGARGAWEAREAARDPSAPLSPRPGGEPPPS